MDLLMNNLERLEELLNKKDEEIEELEAAKSKLEDEVNIDWKWAKHTEIDYCELPVPRLEIKLTTDDEGFKKSWSYGLVYKHTIGTLIFIPIGETRTSGGSAISMDGINADNINNELPFRDGVHIRRDMEHLNLPAFATIKGTSFKLDQINDD